MESEMIVKDSTQGYQARWQVLDDKGNIVDDRTGYLGVGALFSKVKDGVDVMVSIGPEFTPSELLYALYVILYSVVRALNHVGVSAEAEEVIKKAMEKANDLS